MTPALSVLLFAQAMVSSPDATDPEEIVVQALRLPREASLAPVPLTVRTKEQLQGMQGLSLAEGLATVPGVYAQNRTNFAQDLRLSVRGFGARGNFGVRGVKILVDGIPATLPDGQSQVDNIILSELDRIEVLRGGASALYGNGSGGVINLQTAALSGQPEVGAGIHFGAYGFRRSQAQVSGGSGPAAYRVGVWEMESDGYRHHGQAEAFGLSGRLDWSLNDTTQAGLLVNYFDAPEEQDPGGINAAQAAADPRSARDRNVLFDAGEEVEQWQLGATLSSDFDARGQLDARAYVVDRSFANRLPFGGGGAVDLERSLWGAGLTWEWQRDTAQLPFTLQVGLDFDDLTDRRRRFNNVEGVRGDRVLDQRELVTSIGAFAQTVLELGPGELTAGLRYDRIRFRVQDRFLADGDDAGKSTVEEVSPSLSYSLPLGSRWVGYAAYGTSFESPTTTELANPVGGGFNTDLEAQWAQHYDLGMRGTLGPVGVDLSVFLIDIDDELTPFELPEFPGRSFFQNAGESERRGIEASMEWEFGDSWSLSGAYTYSDFEYDVFTTPDADFSGSRLPGVPEHQASLGLAYRNEVGRFANLDVRHAGALYANNANTARVPGFTVTDLRVGQTWARPTYTLTLNLGINNLTDERYFDNIRINAFGGRYFEPAPDRQVYGGVNIQWRR